MTPTSTAGRTCSRPALAGTKGNRLATGRRIKVIAGGMTQTVKIRSGGGYLSQNELRWHFGLSTAAKIDHIEIRWPSGKLDTLMDLPADQFYSVLEGTGVVPAERICPTASAKSKSAASLAIVVQTAPRAVRGGQPPWQ